MDKKDQKILMLIQKSLSLIFLSKLFSDRDRALKCIYKQTGNYVFRIV